MRVKYIKPPLDIRDTQKHTWIDTGVPGGSCWCKHCDVNYGREKSGYCEDEYPTLSLDDMVFDEIVFPFDDFEEII